MSEFAALETKPRYVTYSTSLLNPSNSVAVMSKGYILRTWKLMLKPMLY